MLTGLKVYSKAELESRYEITLENYCKCVSIEALTMVDMSRRTSCLRWSAMPPRSPPLPPPKSP